MVNVRFVRLKYWTTKHGSLITTMLLLPHCCRVFVVLGGCASVDLCSFLKSFRWTVPSFSSGAISRVVLQDRTGTPDSLLASDPGRGVTWSQRSRFLHVALINSIIPFYDRVNRRRSYFLHFFISQRWTVLGPTGLDWWWIHQPARIYELLRSTNLFFFRNRRVFDGCKWVIMPSLESRTFDLLRVFTEFKLKDL